MSGEGRNGERQGARSAEALARGSAERSEAFQKLARPAHTEAAADEDARGPRSRAPLSINDGKGFVFVSHIGNIQPSGFLPLIAGNVRQDELLDAYRNNPLFRELRN